MKKKFILGFLILTLIGCASRKINTGIRAYTGFTELPFPSNNYASGQIVEIFSFPAKVEITHQPSINWDQISTSVGWNISNTATNKIKLTLAAEISNILKGEYNHASAENIKVEFTNTKNTTVQKSVIFAAVSKAISNNPNLKKQIELYMESGTRFDVITQTLSANVSFSLVDSDSNTIDIDSELIEKINSQFDIDFEKTSNSNTVITGSNLVVGIHTDPKLVKLIMEND